MGNELDEPGERATQLRVDVNFSTLVLIDRLNPWRS